MPSPRPWAATARSRPRSRQTSMMSWTARRRSTGWRRLDEGATSPRMAASTAAASTIRSAAAPSRVRRSAVTRWSSVRLMRGSSQDGLGLMREADGQPGAPPGGDGQGARLCRLSMTVLDQQLGERLDGQRRQAEPCRAREDRGQQGRRVVGAEHQASGRTRLLQRLEQRVLGVEVEALRRGDDGHSEATLHRRQRQLRASAAGPGRCGSAHRRPRV